MNILSLTFHCTENALHDWEIYVEETLALLADNLMDAEKYILSEVETEMLNEGKNYNLLLFFGSAEIRNEFMQSEFKNIEERINSKFQDDVMIFKTFLNTKKARL